MATDVNSLDDLELELRKLPGVRAAGFDERDDVLLIQLHVAGETPEQQPVPVSASLIAARHSDRQVPRRPVGAAVRTSTSRTPRRSPRRSTRRPGPRRARASAAPGSSRSSRSPTPTSSRST